MATFTDFEVWYHGKAPIGIMSIVRNEMTYSGLLTVGIAEGDSIHIQANRFNDEYYDEAVEELKEYARVHNGRLEINPLTECKLSFEWIWKDEE